MAQATTEINIVEVFPPTHARLCQMSLAVLETLTSYSEQIPSSPRGQPGHRRGRETDSFYRIIVFLFKI